MAYSTCCGAYTKNTEQDVCPYCRYYCNWEDEEDEANKETLLVNDKIDNE